MTQAQFNELVSQVMQLPYEQRWQLVDQVQESLHPPGEQLSPEEWWEAWRPEIQRRIADMESGNPAIAAEEVLAKLQARRNG